MKTNKKGIFITTIWLAIILMIMLFVVTNLRQKNRRQRFFCVVEVLNCIVRDQWEYSKKFKKYADFTQLAKFSKNKIVIELAKTAKNDIATRYEYNFCMYLRQIDTPSSITSSRISSPLYDVVCYAWPKNADAGYFAYAIDAGTNNYCCDNRDGKYLGDRKPKFTSLVNGINKTWITAGGDGDLEHERMKKEGHYSCD